MEPPEELRMQVQPRRYIVTGDRRETVERFVKGRGRIVHELPLVDGYVVETSEDSLLKAPLPGVQVIPDEKLEWIRPLEVEGPRPLLEASNGTLRMPEVWSRGYTGRGVGVALLDSGTAPHPDFEGRLVFRDFTDRGREEPYDDVGHGTHVAGDAAGSGRLSRGRFRGPAYEATIVSLKVGGFSGPDLSSAIRAIQWAIEHRDEYNIRVMNLSFGFRPGSEPAEGLLKQAIRAARAAGIVTVAAAGNDGPARSTISSPADSPEVLTVGAMDTRGTTDPEDDILARFSSRGPVGENGVKPDLVAPGVAIRSTGATRPYGYRTASGTSMASPIVAGVLATWFQANPELTPEQAITIAEESARPLEQTGLTPNDQGHGVIDAAAGLDRVLALRTSATAVPGPAGAALAAAA